MLGSVLAVLYASLTSPTPSAATSTTVRSSPVTRETSVATAIVPAARRMPRLAPGAPSRRSASDSVSSAPRGTGGRTGMSWVNSSSGWGTNRRRGGGGGTGGNGRRGGAGPRGAGGGGGGGLRRHGVGGGRRVRGRRAGHPRRRLAGQRPRGRRCRRRCLLVRGRR